MKRIVAWTVIASLIYCGTFMAMWMSMPHSHDAYDGHRWRTVEFHHTWLSSSIVWSPCFYVMQHACGYHAEAEWSGGEHEVVMFIKDLN